MTENVPAFLVGDGSAQDGRGRTVLDHGWFRIDELRFEQILALAKEYARLVRYHPEDGGEAAPWEGLFSGSETVVLAEILAHPVSSIERMSASAGGARGRDGDSRRHLSEWEGRLAGAPGAPGSEMRALLRGLRAGLEGADDPLAHLQAIRIAQDAARRLLPASAESGVVEPSTALLVVFARLYARLQQRLDRFALERVDFHLESVLRASPRASRPDHVHLVAPALSGREVAIPAGTEFVADDPATGGTARFALEADARVDDARVARVLTLHATRAPGKPGAARRIGGVWVDEPQEGVSSPLFGAARGGGPSPTARPARVGFMVADPVLLLREGARRVRMVFQFDPETVKDSSIAPLRDDETVETRLRRFFAEFREAFRVHATGPAGWIEIPEYLPGCAHSDRTIPENALSIEFTLAREAPEIVSFSREAHGADGCTALPAVRFEVRDRIDEHPLDLLGGWTLRDIRIDTESRGCRDLELHNQIGPLTPVAPFAPFGPTPTVGAYLAVGCAETQSKTLTRLVIDAAWSDLPRHPDGFEGWYAGYPRPRATTAFRAVPGYLAEGSWTDVPLPEIGDLQLFAPRVENGAVDGIAPSSRISLRRILGRRPARHARHASEPLRYSPTCQGGFVRLSLSAPSATFGHQEYPMLLTMALMRQARLKDLGVAEALPNPPWTPTIASIAIDYAATATICFDEPSSPDDEPHHPRLVHLHPFGWENATRRNAPKVFLVPSIDAPGSLCIGLERGGFGGAASLLLRIAQDSKRIADPSRAGVRWWYMDRNRWIPVAGRDLVSDSTGGLSAEGIVTVSVPEGASRANTAMPPGLLWLRVTCEDYLDHFGRILSVHAQALRAVRMDAAPFAGVALPPGAVKGPRAPVPGLGPVAQPGASRGGRAAESIPQMRRRMAERLRHKGRAISPSDVEQIVLDAYPEVAKVKCFPCLRRVLPIVEAPGHVLVVPLARRDPDGYATEGVSLDGGLLRDIQEYLQDLSSGAAKVAVANPWYERVQVHCTVRFRERNAEGEAIRRLDRAIRDWIDPWSEGGNTRHFGWRLRRQSLEAFIQSLPGVREVGDLSLLRVAPRPGNLFDIEELQPVAGGADELAPRCPWSVPLPIPSHVAVSREALDPNRLTKAGYGDLGIGSTFVIAPGGPA